MADPRSIEGAGGGAAGAGAIRLGIFDLGKTNWKFIVFGDDGAVLDTSSHPARFIESGSLQVLDDSALAAWMRERARAAQAEFGIEGLSFSAHGCTFALLGREGLVHPILDYEMDVPAPFQTVVDAHIPPYDETFSPRLAQGQNLARHLLWMDSAHPGLLGQAEAILGFPQYLTWLFSGVRGAEISYLGCHTHLWSPGKRDFSALVDAKGWRAKMGALAPAGAIVGEWCEGAGAPLRIHNGVHDSSAALALHAARHKRGFTAVSTGTWVVIFNTGASYGVLQSGKDMFGGVAVDGAPSPAIRFMGGREYERLTEGWRGTPSPAAIRSLLRQDVHILPSFAAGGPFASCQGRIVGSFENEEQRAAAALLYLALMTDYCLDLIQSAGDILVDGGLLRQPSYGALLAALRPAQAIFSSQETDGSARGAAMLALQATGAKQVFASVAQRVAAESDAWPGLAGRQRAWRKLVEIHCQ